MASIINHVAEAKGLPNSIQPDSMLPPKLDNPSGFYESNALHEASKSIMDLFGSSWDSPWLEPPDFTNPDVLKHLAGVRERLRSHLEANFWIDKNPTLCLTLGAFDHIFLKRVPVIATLRNPFGVAESLLLRNGFPWNKSLIIWTYYNFHLWLDSERTPLDCFDCSEYEENSLHLSTRLSLSLGKINGLREKQPPSPEDIKKCIDKIYATGSFRDHDISLSGSPVDHEFSEACYYSWEKMKAEFSSGNIVPTKIRGFLHEPLALALRTCQHADGFTTTTSKLNQLYSLTNDHNKLKAERNQLRTQRDQLKTELIHSSAKLTKAEREASDADAQLQITRDNYNRYRLRAQAWQANYFRAMNGLDREKSRGEALLMLLFHSFQLQLRLLILSSRVTRAKRGARQSEESILAQPMD